MKPPTPRPAWEKSIVSRTGGAPTLAFGMSKCSQPGFGGAALKAFWYHFAIMFEALFILTTVDARNPGGPVHRPRGLANLGGPLHRLRDPSWRVGAWVSSLIVVAGWNSILLMGVTDPLGGINTLFPLFGIANQLLAAIADRGHRRGDQEGPAALGLDLAAAGVGLDGDAHRPGRRSSPATRSWATGPSAGTWRHARRARPPSVRPGTPTNSMEVIRNIHSGHPLDRLRSGGRWRVAAGVIVSVHAIRGKGHPLAEEDVRPESSARRAWSRRARNASAEAMGRAYPFASPAGRRGPVVRRLADGRQPPRYRDNRRTPPGRTDPVGGGVLADAPPAVRERRAARCC